MMKRYTQTTEGFVTSVPAGNVGDGLTMAEKVNAQIYDAPATQTVYLDFNSGVGINEEAGLIVNAEGKRVANEYTYQYHVADAISKSGSGYGWYIPTANDPAPTVQYAMTLDKTLKANSIEELAKLMEVDAAELQATIDRYNELCAAGKDEDFGKPADHMIAVEGETYYALKLRPNVTVLRRSGHRHQRAGSGYGKQSDSGSVRCGRSCLHRSVRRRISVLRHGDRRRCLLRTDRRSAGSGQQINRSSTHNKENGRNPARFAASVVFFYTSACQVFLLCLVNQVSGDQKVSVS